MSDDPAIFSKPFGRIDDSGSVVERRDYCPVPSSPPGDPSGSSPNMPDGSRGATHPWTGPEPGDGPGEADPGYPECLPGLRAAMLDAQLVLRGNGSRAVVLLGDEWTIEDAHAAQAVVDPEVILVRSAAARSIATDYPGRVMFHLGGPRR